MILSPQEYERLHALNADEFQRFCDHVGEAVAALGLTADKLTQMLADQG